VGTNSGLQSITAVILGGASLAGGIGGVPGTLIGVLILGTLSNGMTVISVPTFYQTIATGVVLLLAVGISQIRRIAIRRRAPLPAPETPTDPLNPPKETGHA
jgi:ribose transport system permease protein